jgi:hypothetical protein
MSDESILLGRMVTAESTTMNLKKAKELRKKARTLMVRFVKEKILTPETTADKTDDELLAALPRRIHMRQGRRQYNAVATQRWFIRKVKANPEVTFDEIISEIYPNEEGCDD